MSEEKMDRTVAFCVGSAVLALAIFIGGVSFWVSNNNHHYWGALSRCIEAGGTPLPVRGDSVTCMQLAR